MPNEAPMTRDRARKRSVRARMTASGEPYSVAARKLASSAEPALSLLAERVNATLAARSARIRYRVETDLATREDLRAKFVRFIGDAAAEAHRPRHGSVHRRRRRRRFHRAADRPISDLLGGYATVVTGGRQFFGRTGESVEEHPSPDSYSGDDWLLEPLEWVRGTAIARFGGEDIVRDTPCQVIAAETRLAPVCVLDGRRLHPASPRADREVGHMGDVRGQATLELWDFGVAAETLDWSRFPGPR